MVQPFGNLRIAVVWWNYLNVSIVCSITLLQLDR